MWRCLLVVRLDYERHIIASRSLKRGQCREACRRHGENAGSEAGLAFRVA